jgi:hypothetical protein
MKEFMSEKKGMHDFDANNLIGIKDAQSYYY